MMSLFQNSLRKKACYSCTRSARVLHAICTSSARFYKGVHFHCLIDSRAARSSARYARRRLDSLTISAKCLGDSASVER